MTGTGFCKQTLFSDNANSEPRSQSMKVFLKNTSKLLFLTPQGNWSQSLAQAQDFRTTLAALDYCSSANLQGMQILLQLDAQQEYHLFEFSPLPI